MPNDSLLVVVVTATSSENKCEARKLQFQIFEIENEVHKETLPEN